MATEHRVTMSQDALRRSYDEVAETYASYIPDASKDASLDLAMIREFADLCAGEPDGRILDAGCGAGRLARHLSDLDCDVEGLDQSPAMIDLARTNNPDLLFSVGSLAELPYRDDQFAGVLLWYSIIHTPSQALEHVFIEAARVLRPGGHVLVGFQVGHGTRDLAEVYRGYGHEVELERYRHTISDVGAILQTAGFAIRAHLFRRPDDGDGDDQAVMLATLG